MFVQRESGSLYGYSKPVYVETDRVAAIVYMRNYRE